MDNARRHADILEKLELHYLKAGYAPDTIKQRLSRMEALPVHPTVATQADVLASLPARTCPATKRVYLSSLKASFRELMLLGIVDHDPTVGVRLPKRGRGEPRPLTDDQLRILLAQSGPERSWTVLGCYAGLRSAEVVNLYAEDLVMTDYGYAIEVLGKGDVKSLIPAHPEVVALFERGAQRGPLWRMRPDSMSGRWTAWAAELGLPALRFHQCRHTYGTRLYQQTQDILTTSKLMRHANINTTTVYTRLADDSTYQAVANL